MTTRPAPVQFDERRFPVNLEITIRACIPSDVSKLEWFGRYTRHREIISDAFRRQQEGDVLMLVADLDNFPIGQLWIDLVKKKAESTGVLWALRVIPFLRGYGIGSRLMIAGEDALRSRGFTWVELGVEKASTVGQLYERLGYRQSETICEETSYTTPDGEFVRHYIDQWIYRKKL